MHIIPSYEDCSKAEIDYYFMHLLSDWFNHTKRSDEDVMFALKHVSLADYCTKCDQTMEGSRIGHFRWPVGIDETRTTDSWIVAEYDCHVCGHRWTCGYSKEYVNVFSFE